MTKNGIGYGKELSLPEQQNDRNWHESSDDSAS